MLKRNASSFSFWIAPVFLIWLAAVIFLDVRLQAWWAVGATIARFSERLTGGFSHPEVIARHLLSIGFIVWFATAAFGMGVPIARFLLGKEQRRGERWLFGILLGTVGLGLLTFVAGIAGLWNVMTAPGILGAFALQAVLVFLREKDGLAIDARRAIRSLTPGDWLVLTWCAVVGAFTLLYSLSPPVQSDALRYHLGAPEQWIQRGRIVYLPGYAHSNMPFLVEMNFALALMLHLPAGAKLAHLFTFALGCGAVGCIAGRLAPAAAPERAPRPSLLAAALLWTHPVAAPVAAWAYVDMAALAYTAAMVWALMRWSDRPGPRGLALAAAFGGAAFACKYTNLLPLGFGGLIAAALVWGRATPRSRSLDASTALIRFGLLGALICSPWLLRNTATTGNPVYPLAYGLFGGSDWSEFNDEFYKNKAGEKGSPELLLQAREMEANYAGRPGPTEADWRAAGSESPAQAIGRHIALPWTTYRYPMAFEDFPQGPAFLLLAPIGILAGLIGCLNRSPPRIWIPGAFAAFLFVSWAATYQSNRFLVPVVALLFAFLAAWAHQRQALMRWAARGAVAFLLLAQGMWVAQFIAAMDPYAALRYSLGVESRREFLERSVPYYDAAQWIGEQAELRELDLSVFLVGEHRSFYFPIRARGADWFDTPAPLRLLRETPDADEAIDRLLVERTPIVLFNMEELLAGHLTQSDYERFVRVAGDDAGKDALREILLRPPAPGSNYWYFRKRIQDGEEFDRWIDFALSARLEPVRHFTPLIWISRIAPPE